MKTEIITRSLDRSTRDIANGILVKKELELGIGAYTRRFGGKDYEAIALDGHERRFLIRVLREPKHFRVSVEQLDHERGLKLFRKLIAAPDYQSRDRGLESLLIGIGREQMTAKDN